MVREKRPDKVSIWVVVGLGLLVVLGITDFWGLDLAPGLETVSDDAQAIIQNIWLATVVIIVYLESQLGWLGNVRD